MSKIRYSLSGLDPEVSNQDRDRFWIKVDTESTPAACWNWLGKLNREGRGRFTAQGIQDLCYRWVLALQGHRFTQGHVVDHLCNNPSCVRPSHLRVTDHAGNMRRMGEQERGPSKLTRRQADEIRRRRSAPDRPTQRELAAEYGVDQSLISLVENGRIWNW